MVHDSEGSLGILPSIHEFTEKINGQQVDEFSKVHKYPLVQALSTNSKAISSQGQACNLASSHLDIDIEAS